jgi:hypothetical protein
VLKEIEVMLGLKALKVFRVRWDHKEYKEQMGLPVEIL